MKCKPPQQAINKPRNDCNKNLLHDVSECITRPSSFAFLQCFTSITISSPRVSFVFFVQANKNLDMSINASNNFNLNITWSLSSTGRGHVFFSRSLFYTFSVNLSLFHRLFGVASIHPKRCFRG